MMKKNDKFEVRITDISDEGAGIGRAGGLVWFIKDALPGDQVEAAVTKLKKNYGFARLVRVLEASKDRVEPACGIARQCGGCQLQAMDYAAQLRFKEAKVLGNLQRIGGFDLTDVSVEPIIGMEDPFRYRNKAQYPIGRDKDGRIIAGFYAGRTHSIIACEDCLLGCKENRDILKAIIRWMEDFGIEPYEEESGKGLVRHVLIRKARASGQIMVCLVGNARKLPHAEELVEALLRLDLPEAEAPGAAAAEGRRAALPEKTEPGEQPGKTKPGISAEKLAERNNPLERTAPLWRATEEIQPKEPEPCVCTKMQGKAHIASISYNINMDRTNVILGGELINLYGPGYIEDSIRRAAEGEASAAAKQQPVHFHISPLSFYQVNPGQMERLYSTALSYAELTGKETVWDLYCGIGTISLFLAQNAKKVYGVEIIPQAIENARENAALNGIRNAEFFVGKAEEVLPAWYEGQILRQEKTQECKAGLKTEGRTEICCERVDVIVVDPPRKGCDEKCLETMVKIAPERIVYVSCDSATLARDLRYLCANGYVLKKVRACDMFGQTVHVEVVIQMTFCSDKKIKG